MARKKQSFMRTQLNEIVFYSHCKMCAAARFPFDDALCLSVVDGEFPEIKIPGMLFGDIVFFELLSGEL